MQLDTTNIMLMFFIKSNCLVRKIFIDRKQIFYFDYKLEHKTETLTLAVPTIVDTIHFIYKYIKLIFFIESIYNKRTDTPPVPKKLYINNEFRVLKSTNTRNINTLSFISQIILILYIRTYEISIDH